MNEINITNLICAFVRAYHYENSNIKVFKDNISRKLFSNEEWNLIIDKFTSGMKYSNPNFYGTKEESMKWIMNNQIGPLVLGRCAYAEESLINATKFGTKQYLTFANDYDTYAYRYNNIETFEIASENSIKDKQERLNKALLESDKCTFIKAELPSNEWLKGLKDSKYDNNKITFCNLMGVTYHLSKEDFSNFIKHLATIICDGSTIVLDFKSEMNNSFKFQEIEKILEKNGILIYEHLNENEITEKYFGDYNILNPNYKMKSPKAVEYILAVKKGIV